MYCNVQSTQIKLPASNGKNPIIYMYIRLVDSVLCGILLQQTRYGVQNEPKKNKNKIGIKKIRRTHMGWGVLLELLYTNHPPLPLQSQILPSSMR